MKVNKKLVALATGVTIALSGSASFASQPEATAPPASVTAVDEGEEYGTALSGLRIKSCSVDHLMLPPKKMYVVSSWNRNIKTITVNATASQFYNVKLYRNNVHISTSTNPNAVFKVDSAFQYGVKSEWRRGIYNPYCILQGM